MDNSELIDKKPNKKKTIWLIIIILALIASSVSFTLFYLKQKSEIDTLKTQNAKLTDDNRSLERVSNTAVSSTGDYREIPELGVKYKVTDTTKDLTYLYRKGNGKNPPQYGYVSFSSVKLSAIGDGTTEGSCDASNDALGKIFKLAPTESYLGYGTAEEMFKEKKQDIKKVNDFYLLYIGPQAACTTESDPDPNATPKDILKSVTAI